MTVDEAASTLRRNARAAEPASAFGDGDLRRDQAWVRSCSVGTKLAPVKQTTSWRPFATFCGWMPISPPFYAAAAASPELRWVTPGAGRMTRCQTVFEDVVKTICTTNCTWSATVRMVQGLVAGLGEPAVGCTGEWVGGPRVSDTAGDGGGG